MFRNRGVYVSCFRLSMFSALLIFAVLSSGCGSQMGGAGTPPPPPATSASQIKIGDAPADRVVSFEISAGPITMTPASGSAVTVLSTSRRIELTHLAGTNEPLALLNVPQGTYNSMSITVSKPEVSFMNNLGVLVKLEPAFNQAITISFSPALTVGAGASVVNIDLNVAKSLTFDAQGNVTGVSMSSASFTVSTAPVAAAEAEQEAEDGEFEDTTGMVTSVNGTSFALTVGQSGTSLTFTTDSNTQFSDGATLGTMVNTIVKVEGITKMDGTLYAKEVEGIENNAGMELEGLISQVTGNPATQLQVVAQDGIGSGMDDTKVGTQIAINVSGAQYRVDSGNIDTSGIGGLPSSPNFPFDATTVHAGQRIETESSSAMSSAVVADKVKLRQQSLSGTVSGLAGSTSAGPVTFTLTVASDSAFAMLSGQTTVTVFWQPGTNLHNVTSVKNGDTVQVRGLVFFGGSGVNMIARRIGN